MVLDCGYGQRSFSIGVKARRYGGRERHEWVSFPVVKLQKIFSNNMTTEKCFLNFRN